MVKATGVPQLPIRTRGARKHDVRTQFAALCYRPRDGRKGIEVLLVTSRESGRWLVPKGWPMDRQTPAAAAAREAYEEAGVLGRMRDEVIGLYSYQKEMVEDALPCVVAVFALEVREVLKDYPEASERKRKWFSARKAAAKVKEPELAEIIRSFAGRTARG
ncbi:NUDIX hydrolase [Maritimibacter sp. 55A14]|uniref:NUDIX hydrolase n=1 Tax=Maritimibacter sp. 55A14 TaxID=2174844 RepID=UPI000D61ED73|nr:NUDIX hydrolase [Maritimibacter sp. 55A14]PWE33307.1 NUDIX hydrolase [Maritimibacter sp. 55A14]